MPGHQVNMDGTIPGRDGVLLNYIIRDSVQSKPTPCDDFIDEYVLMAPIDHGGAYHIDAAEVHTLLVKFTTGNKTAEMWIKVHEPERKGKIDWITFLSMLDVQILLCNIQPYGLPW